VLNEDSTDNFAGVPRDMDAILAFKEEIKAVKSQKRPFPEFRHCPYIGLNRFSH
jgi:hypothetical protein